MATISDVFQVCHRIDTVTSLFGCSDEFLDEFLKRFRNLGKAICREQKIPWGNPEIGMKIPLNTILGQESEAHLRELENWLLAKQV